MIEEFQNIVAVGFDLDGTLYNTTPAIDNRVRTKIAEKILEKMPTLESVEGARDFYETSYKILSSGTKVLEEIGYENSREVMDECLATADVLDLINDDQNLEDILKEMRCWYFTYLLTSSPKPVALKKLEKIGISPGLFYLTAFSDTPSLGNKQDGAAFKYVIKESSIAAANHVYIGDRLNSDILPAKRLGMKTIAVWSEIPEADYSIKDIHDIRRTLL